MRGGSGFDVALPEDAQESAAEIRLVSDRYKSEASVEQSVFRPHALQCLKSECVTLQLVIEIDRWSSDGQEGLRPLQLQNFRVLEQTWCVLVRW